MGTEMHNPVHSQQKAAEPMEHTFMDVGLKNPAPKPGCQGFLQLFAEWLIMEDLPWTTGEAPSLKQLFKFIDVC
jgi:hypothetical protein